MLPRPRLLRKTDPPKTRRKLRESVKKRVAYLQRWQCVGEHCSEPDRLLPSTFQVDHIDPHALGGTDDLSNLRALCPTCHAAITQKAHGWIGLAKRLPYPEGQRLCIHCKRVVSPDFLHDCEGEIEGDYEGFKAFLEGCRYTAS